ncbi:hypothetical protein PFAS1_23340 [Pseudomonas frederiksbergensis]|nr:hypothetical protein PFAS1_23340 [Pseudomonas frederiksbergensis]
MGGGSVNTKIEVWKDAPGLSGRYMVSSWGRVKRIAHSYITLTGIQKNHSERILQRKKTEDYPRFNLQEDGKAKAYLVHRLIAQAFVPNPHEYSCVNHIDGDKSNPHPENLEWCTHQQNMQHAIETGLSKFSVPVMCADGGSGFWFPSLKSAVEHTGVSKPCICAAAKKKQKTAGGMVWDYTDLLSKEAA